MKGRDNLQGCGQDQGKPGRDDKVLLGVIITPRPEEAAVREERWPLGEDRSHLATTWVKVSSVGSSV